MTFITSLISALAYSSPLILCSLGALFSEYAGCLALFLDGLVSFSAFLFYTFTVTTGSPLLAALLTCLAATVLVLAFSALIEVGRANRFIAAIALNLLFGALTSCLSSLIFGTRGVLTNESFTISAWTARSAAVSVTAIFVALAVVFLKYSRPGLYIRVTGSDADVLKAKGVNPGNLRSIS